jgi:hypothetical protein
MKGYDTADYAATRLNETIIMYKGRPITVKTCTQFGAEIAVSYFDVITEQSGQAFLKDIDLNPPLLGYVNIGNKNCQYITRMPMRKDWKQGVRKNNIVTPTGHTPDISMKHLAKTIMNEFPSLTTVVGKLKDFIKGGYIGTIAFSRDFAADTTGRVYYKSMFSIGEVDLKTGGIKIKPEYEWVREALMEVTGEVA